MLMLLAPVAVGLLGVATKAAKQWRVGKEIKNNNTAVVKIFVTEKEGKAAATTDTANDVVNLLVTEQEWDVITTSGSAEEVQGALNKGIHRHAIAALNKKGAIQ